MFLSITPLSTLCWFLANTAAKKWCFTLQNESIQLPLLSFCWCFQTLSTLPLFAFVCFFYFFICLKDIRHFRQPFYVFAEPEDYIYLLEVILKKNLILFISLCSKKRKGKKKKMYPYFLKIGNNFIIFIMVLPLNKHKKILEARK